MTRVVFVLLSLCFALGSCTQRMICPAYQSAFIHDKDELRKKFSYFQNDSTPKVLTASKNKYLVAEPVSYRRKLRTLETVEAKQVFVKVPDSLSNADSVSMADFDKATRSVIDSTFIVDVPQSTDTAQVVEDSVYVISKDKELRLLKYNMPDSLVLDPTSGRYVREKPKYYVKDVRYMMEQDNYMWYLRDHLVLPDVRIAKSAQGKRGGESEQNDAKPKGSKGFFKNLFKKKNKQAADSTSSELPAAPKEEFDFIDEADTVQQITPAEKPQVQQQDEPKPLREKKTRKKKKEPKVEPANTEDKKKEENDDDGF